LASVLRYAQKVIAPFFESLWVHSSKLASTLMDEVILLQGVRGARASRVLLSASRREPFGRFGRDAQTDMRDACAPRTMGSAARFLNAAGLAPQIFTLQTRRSSNSRKSGRAASLFPRAAWCVGRCEGDFHFHRRAMTKD